MPDGTRNKPTFTLIKLLLLLSLSIPAWFCNAQERMLLHDAWEFRREGDTAWHRATVPGTIHTDLMAHAMIPDPFILDNESKVQWVGEETWIYRCRFDYTGRIQKDQKLEMVFEGLDTYASISLNNKKIGETNNMFRTWRFDVSHRLQASNLLEIRFRPAKQEGRTAAGKLPYTLPGEERVFVRKAQYHFGWDWGPVLLTCGIWKPVYIIKRSSLNINSIHILNTFLSTDTALLKMQAEIETSQGGNFIFSLKRDDIPNPEFELPLRLKKGINSITFEYKLANPQLWWPNGLGEPQMTVLKAGLTGRDLPEAGYRLVTGIRTVELVQEPDSIGRSFYFRINGLPVFMRGANYIPQDNFLPRVDSMRYVNLIRDAAQAGMNMLRVWGGGIFEQDLFYDLCDREGILVWQDFMFACAMYPGDEAFTENVRQEVTEQVSRLRNHPCIAIWCGNNEIDEGWHNWGWQKQYGYSPGDSATIWRHYLQHFHTLIPEELEKLDPGRPYHPSSPATGWGRKESLLRGDLHYWGVWWGMEDFSMYEKKVGRFVSEYGFQGFPDINTINSFAVKEDNYLRSPVMMAHQKHPTGYQTIETYMERGYPVPSGLEDYIYVSQLLQAEGIVRAIEAHRRAKPRCMGSLYWQLNDCWPVVSWSGIDWYGRWKAMHYMVRRAFAPILVSPYMETSGDISICLVNDGPSVRSGRLELRLLTFYGHQMLYRAFRDVQIPTGENTILTLYAHEFEHYLQQFGRDKCVLEAKFTGVDDREHIALMYFALPKELRLTHEVEHDISTTAPGTFMVRLKAKKLAKNVQLYLEGKDARFEDNFFDLTAGEERTIRYTGECSEKEFRRLLRIRSLASVPH